MSRRWRTGLALLLLAVGVLAVPAVHWRLIGWARGEAFYAGRPTAYWTRYIHECEFVDSFLSGDIYFFTPEPRDFQAWLHHTFGLADASRAGAWIDDPAALPLLLELLDQDDLKVQLFAVVSLSAIGPAAQPAASRLRALAQTTPHYLAYREARFVLWAISPEPRGTELLTRADEKELYEAYRKTLRLLE